MSMEEIHLNLLNNTNDKFDKSNGSWTFDIEKSVAIELSKQEIQTENIMDKIDVEKLTGDELTRFVFQRTGIKRREATYASGKVEITVQAPTTLYVGDLVAAEDVFFEGLDTTTFTEAGNYSVWVRCILAGGIGNVPSGAINAFPTTLANISAVENKVAFDNGYPAETDSSLRQRYYDKLQRPGKAGNKYHYREWAQAVEGVGKVKVFPRWAGVLTVKVAILDTNNEIAPQSLIDRVFEHIETERPFGADVTVVTGDEMVVGVTGEFLLKDGYVWGDVQPKLVEKLSLYFKEIAFEENLNYISYAQIGREILGVGGIEDYANLLLNNETGNIAIGELQVPIVGEVTNI